MMPAGRGYSKEPVRIVIINTKYVQTDAGSFKSVVQKLTGKDSHDDDEEEAPASRKASLSETKAQGPEVSAGGGSSFLMRDLSFKELDRLMREMPPIHEIWSEYQ